MARNFFKLKPPIPQKPPYFLARYVPASRQPADRQGAGHMRADLSGLRFHGRHILIDLGFNLNTVSFLIDSRSDLNTVSIGRCRLWRAAIRRKKPETKEKYRETI